MLLKELASNLRRSGASHFGRLNWPVYQWQGAHKFGLLAIAAQLMIAKCHLAAGLELFKLCAVLLGKRFRWILLCWWEQFKLPVDRSGTGRHCQMVNFDNFSFWMILIILILQNFDKHFHFDLSWLSWLELWMEPRKLAMSFCRFRKVNRQILNGSWKKKWDRD